MATPIGHAVAGLVISGVSKPQTRKERIALALVCTFAALAPDLDVIPGLLLGTPARFHGGISHSLGFAVALSLAIAVAYRLVGKPSKEIFLLAVTAYISHLALDMLGPDGRPPYGIPFFWPLSGQTFISPVSILLGARHAASASSGIQEWAGNLLSLRNVAAIALEMILLLPIVIAVKMWDQATRVKVFSSFKGVDWQPTWKILTQPLRSRLMRIWRKTNS